MSLAHLLARRGLVTSLAAALALGPVCRLALAQAAPASPQAGMSGPGMAGMGQNMGKDPMMALMAASPHAILAHRTALGLTAQQVTSLRELEHAMTAHHDSTMQAMAPLHARIAQVTDVDSLDDAALRTVLADMGGLHARMMGDMVRIVHAARAILTPVQRQRLAALPMTMNKGAHDMSCGAM